MTPYPTSPRPCGAGDATSGPAWRSTTAPHYLVELHRRASSQRVDPLQRADVFLIDVSMELFVAEASGVSAEPQLRIVQAGVTNPGESSRTPAPSGPHAGLPDELVGRQWLRLLIARDLFDDEFLALTGRRPDGPLHFRGQLDLSGTGRCLRSVLEAIAVQFQEASPVLDHPHLRLAHLRALASAMLLSQPSNFSTVLHRGQSPLRPRTLRRALDHISAHLGDELTLAHVATAAGCSTRTLSSTFRDHLGITPMAHVRNLRLEAVREEIVASDELISTIAYRWGFGHLGRFAALYERRFGELPSRTRPDAQVPRELQPAS